MADGVEYAGDLNGIEGSRVRYSLGPSGATTVNIDIPGRSLAVEGSSGMVSKDGLLKQINDIERDTNNYVSSLNGEVERLKAELNDPSLSPRMKALREREISATNEKIIEQNKILAAVGPARQEIQNNFDSRFQGLQEQMAAAEKEEANRIAKSQAAEQTTDKVIGNSPNTADPQVVAPTGEANAEPLTQTEKDRLSQSSAENDDNTTQPVTSSPGTVRPAESARPAPEEPTPATSEKQQQKDTIDVKDNEKPNQTTTQPYPNPLLNYASYTYGITLFILSKDDYNTLIKTPKNFAPKNAIVSSAGRFAETRRNEHFQEDFYIQDLKMTTVVGLNSKSRGSNSIEMSFTIIEPYGVTLLDRIANACTDLGAKNYLEQPYLLKINFYGHGDDGSINTPIAGLSKIIPIKLIEFKIKVGTSGSQYSIRAVPFNHGAFSESTATTPANFEVTAKSITDFFKSSEPSSYTKEKSEREKKVSDAKQTANGGFRSTEAREAALAKQKEAEKEATAPYRISSYVSAYNDWQNYLVKNKNSQYSDTIDIVIDKKIADKGAITFPEKNRNPNKPMVRKDDPNQVSKANDPKAKIDMVPDTFSINAGTNVIDVINLVMRNTEYIRSQVVDQTSGELPQEKTIQWYKIIPQIEIKNFDETTNRYSRFITYYVKSYEYFNTKHPNGPMSRPSKAVKEYNYIYTGKNQDILDFSIDFDTAYYQKVIVDRAKIESLSGNPKSDDSQLEAKGKPGSIVTERGIQQRQTQFISGDAQGTAGGNMNDGRSAAVASLEKSIMSSSRGDMISVKLKIIGDPMFIKQDDVFANPSQADYEDKEIIEGTGSLAMDYTEIFCRVNFLTPVDIDETTGMMAKNEKYHTSGFSGMYKVLTVENEWRSGKFEQTLDLVRIFDKPGEAKPKSDAGAGRGTSAAAEGDVRRTDRPPPTTGPVTAAEVRKVDMAKETATNNGGAAAQVSPPPIIENKVPRPEEPVKTQPASTRRETAAVSTSAANISRLDMTAARQTPEYKSILSDIQKKFPGAAGNVKAADAKYKALVAEGKISTPTPSGTKTVSGNDLSSEAAQRDKLARATSNAPAQDIE